MLDEDELTSDLAERFLLFKSKLHTNKIVLIEIDKGNWAKTNR
jgi:hypothetical protein